MKTSHIWLALTFCLVCVACTPPEEEVHPKRRSVRTDNLQRYMNKAQEHRARAQARSKPIVEKPLIEENVLKQFRPQMPDLRISAQIFAQQNQLESSIRETYAKRAAEQVVDILNQFQQEAVAVVSAAQTPQELAAKLKEQTAAYSQKLDEFAQAQQQRSWTLPDAEQSRISRQALRDAAAPILEEVTRDYGDSCAQKTKMILQKTADDYGLVLSSVSNREDMQSELNRVAQEADEAFRLAVLEYGDPVLTLSEEQAASLRARLISAHQQIETQFEKLYGKDAVLQTRDIFEQYRTAADDLLHKPARLSLMQNELNKLGERYRAQMTELQVRLNEEIERRTAERAEMIPTGV